MVPELGLLALLIALALAALLSIFPFIGVRRGYVKWQAMARPLSFGVLFFTLVSYLILTYGFLVDDFTVSYVANNSNSHLPWYYKITAVWSSHEGSFLLWMLILAAWIGAVAAFSRSLDNDMRALVLSVMGWIYIGFSLFIATVSNPFARLLPMFPVDGGDMNPLLQDPGMIIHPPMLYMGYVGFSVAFAFAIAALISGRLDAAWARWSRPWTLAAWIFLTIGIALGSWWAYYELGWGGWWFWDPVENASLMPWLVGTALIHSLAVTEKRGVFKAWTVFLAIAAFSLSLLGTFLVRSGVLVSVHAFASDPARGLFILALLLIAIGGSLALFMTRASHVKSNVRYELFSREVMLLGNNIMFVTATIVVLLGTLWPLVHKQLGLGTISIGVPFFNQILSIWIVPFVILVGIGPLTRWRRQQFEKIKGQLLLALLLAVVLGFALPYIFASQADGFAIFGLIMGIWVVVTTIEELRLRHNAGVGLMQLQRSHWGMVLGHLGFAMVLIGVTLTSVYSVEKDVRMSAGDTAMLSDYEFHFQGVSPLKGPNYDGHVGVVDVKRNGNTIATLRAEKRFYLVQRNVMTEAAIDAGFTRDLYVALGEQLSDGSWALRLYVKPFVRWLWLGSIFMALGGLLSLTDKRYRALKKVKTHEVKLAKNEVVA